MLTNLPYGFIRLNLHVYNEVFFLKKGIKMDIIYEDENIQLKISRQKKVLMWEWKKFIPETTYRDSLEIVLNTICDNDVEKCLVDMRKLSVIPRGAQKWTDDTWMPRAKAEGVRHFAIVRAPPTIAIHFVLYMQQQELMERN